jgi:excisionase family DNA binding protein
MTQRAYTVKTLAAHWDCSPRHIYTLIETGQIRAFRIGKRGLRITPDEVLRWEQTSAVEADQPLSDRQQQPGAVSTLPAGAHAALLATRGKRGGVS